MTDRDVRASIEQAPLIELPDATRRRHSSTRESGHGILHRRVSEIEAKPIRWLWRGRIARGKVSLIAGQPGLGKSQLTAALAAVVTTGGTWPVDRTRCERGEALLLSAEDDPADTIRPRLEAAGADLSRVRVIDAIRDGADRATRMFNLADDIARLDHLLAEVGDVALLVVDPITAYLGATDSHKNAEVRALLAPLAELAARHGVAVVAVSHFNKTVGGDALARVIGSVAFIAAARAAFAVVRDSDDPERRLFLPLKNNIGNDRTGLAFGIEGVTLGGGIETSRIAWEPDPVSVMVEEALAPTMDHGERNAAKDFLADLLAGGPLSANDVKRAAERAGHAWATVRRAKDALGIVAEKEGFGGGWRWRLPAKMLTDAEDAHLKNVSAFAPGERLREDSSPSVGAERESFEL